MCETTGEGTLRPWCGGRLAERAVRYGHDAGSPRRFWKLVLRQDMSGGGKGVSSAAAITYTLTCIGAKPRAPLFPRSIGSSPLVSIPPPHTQDQEEWQRPTGYGVVAGGVRRTAQATPRRQLAATVAWTGVPYSEIWVSARDPHPSPPHKTTHERKTNPLQDPAKRTPPTSHTPRSEERRVGKECQ